jgi:hypothetical protein
MEKEFSAYNEDGKVEDPDVAHTMADAENPYHDKVFFGLVKPSKGKLEKGEKAGEDAVEAGEPINKGEIPEDVERRFYAFRASYRDARTGQFREPITYSKVDYGNGKVKYRIHGIMAEHDERGHFESERPAYYEVKTLNGEVAKEEE